MTTRTRTCPVLVRIAFCSIVHSSGASRLTLLQCAAQPGGAGGAAAAVPDGEGAGAGAGVAWAGALDLGACWARRSPIGPKDGMEARMAIFRVIFTDQPPGNVS